MTVPYTIILSDSADHDTGFRGYRTYWWLATIFGAYAELGLYWFLVAYSGRSSVRILTPKNLLLGDKLSTNWLFVGLPTNLSKEHLKKIRYCRIILYDSSDFDGINFDYSDRQLLLSHTDTCLKTWRNHKWNLDLNVGLLPIKRPPLNNKLRYAVYRDTILCSVGLRSRVKQHDVCFVGRPTDISEGNSRTRWLLELKRQSPELRLWGGLVGGREWSKERLDNKQRSLWLDTKKIGFRKYYRGLSLSKVALTPRGFAPWTYRHYEAVYARTMIVSTCLSDYEFLVPLPTKGIFTVKDNEPVVPAVEKAIALYDQSPEILEENVENLERWISRNRYSRSRPILLDRFFEQIN